MSFSSNEQPWTEAQWEAYLKEADLRAARFGELLETLQDHPNCEEIVSHEMGWDKPVEQDEEVKAFIDELNAAAAREDWSADELDEEADDIDDGEIDAANRETGRSDAELVDGATVDGMEDDPFDDPTDEFSIKLVTAYNLAMEVGEQVHQALRPYLRDEAEDDDADERLSEAVINSLIPAAKIAKGHGLGYDDDVLCGNIVCCKTALQSATKSREALESLGEDGFLPPALVNQLVPRVREVEQAIQERIDSLRGKVWW